MLLKVKHFPLINDLLIKLFPERRSVLFIKTFLQVIATMNKLFQNPFVLTIPTDPPRFDAEELEAFKAPVIVKKGHRASFKMSYVGREPFKVQWYLDGEELSEETNITLTYSDGYTSLFLNKLQRKDSGEVKLKLKNEFGTVEAFSQLVVLGMY